MLIKQWLTSYRHKLHGPSHDLARLRQQRSMDFEAWGVPQLVASLPLLLSVSLLEFLVGLSIFLYSINKLIGWLVLGSTAIIVTLHLASLILPAVSSCPYRTAASPTIFKLAYPFKRLSWSIKYWVLLLVEIILESPLSKSTAVWLFTILG